MYNKIFQSMWIEVVCGPMFSGKTEELLRKLNRFYWAKIPFIIFKPQIDTRGSMIKINSRDGRAWSANSITKPNEVFEILALPENRHTKVIAFDEAQFFDNSIIEVIQTLAKNGYHIIVACLDRDWQAKPFGPVPELLAIADEVIKLSAFCSVCAMPATFTERVSNFDKDIILIGDSESYEARCRTHHHTFNHYQTPTDKEFKQKLKG